MDIKSVPPEVAPAFRHMLIAKPLMIPPKILISKTSCVMIRPGIKSVRKLFRTIIRQEYSVNFFPIYRKPIYTGIRFSNIFMRLNGSFTCANSSKALCINMVSPVTPPGYKPPVFTNVFVFSA